jgi:hypothetical protein
VKLTFPGTVSILTTLLAISLAGGCAGHAGGVTLTSMRTHECFDQGFADAYLSHNENGDVDIVLVDAATADVLAGNTPKSPVRQIMHVRVLWQPERDLKVTDAAASNATIHWYVMSGKPQGMLEYSGTAFVSTTSFSELVRVHIQNAQVQPLPCSAALHDPVGPSKLEGTVYAHDNPQVVTQLLNEVRTAVANADSAHPAAYLPAVSR